MTKIAEVDEQGFQDWLASRPASVQELAKKVRPGILYRLQKGNHKVYLESYQEDGTVTVVVDAHYNAVVFERSVFGIKPEDLEECDLPREDEPTGIIAALVQELS